LQLLLYTDYALRVLIYAATHPSDPVAAAAIADAYGISPDHVAKAAKALTRHGLLRSTRGVGGGVRLARAAGEIRIGDVVRLFEKGRGAVACLQTGGPPCKIEPACRLRHAFERAESAFYRELDAVTLEDVVSKSAGIVRLLASRQPPRPRA
jgi:Rrf2 family transcriptional regulator, nitric oxide-sensitive transcriptional repressor